MRRTAVLLSIVLALANQPPARSANLDLIRPVKGSILRHFELPPTPYAAGHRGIDMAVPEGTIVRASAPGVVAFAGRVGGDLFVSIDHGGGYRTTYSFLQSTLVAKGAQVEQGQPVARSGLGHAGSDQPHLHFGLRQGDDYLDPERYLLASMRRDLSRVVRLAFE